LIENVGPKLASSIYSLREFGVLDAAKFHSTIHKQQFLLSLITTRLHPILADEAQHLVIYMCHLSVGLQPCSSQARSHHTLGNSN